MAACCVPPPPSRLETTKPLLKMTQTAWSLCASHTQNQTLQQGNSPHSASFHFKKQKQKQKCLLPTLEFLFSNIQICKTRKEKPLTQAKSLSIGREASITLNQAKTHIFTMSITLKTSCLAQAKYTPHICIIALKMRKQDKGLHITGLREALWCVRNVVCCTKCLRNTMADIHGVYWVLLWEQMSLGFFVLYVVQFLMISITASFYMK